MKQAKEWGIKVALLALLLLPSGRALAAQDCEFGSDQMDDIRRIRDCLSRGVTWNSGGDGTTMLHYAARYTSNPTVVSLFLEAGYDPNAKDDEGSTPLHYATLTYGREQSATVLTSVLLDAGADPNARDNDGDTPLHNAILAGQMSLMSILLDAGADANIRDHFGMAPLHWTASWGDHLEVSVLLDAGADPSAITYSDDGETPLHSAVLGASMENIDGDHLAVIATLLKAGADPMAPSADGRTPLHSVFSRSRDANRDRPLISALLDGGAGEDLTPAHIAVLTGDLVQLKEALERGVDPNTADAYGWTPLHFAGLAGSLIRDSAMIRELVATGANPSARDRNGLTPLGVLSKYGGEVWVVRALLEAGANGGAEAETGGVQSGLSTDVHVAASELDPGDTFRDCDRCPELVVVPAGSFMMGLPESQASFLEWELPRHRVTIGSRFAVGVYEVTFAEWDTCALAGGCGGYWPADEGWGRGSRPVANVSWEDTQAYLAWFSAETGEHYRLLSEAEWEYVARAHTETARYWGESEAAQCRYANAYDQTTAEELDTGLEPVSCSDGYSGTAPVGSFEPNAFGLYDVLGNVKEWTGDCWNNSYSGAPADGSAWRVGDCSERMVRGGSWLSVPQFVHSARRGSETAGRRDRRNGFRVARTIN